MSDTSRELVKAILKQTDKSKRSIQLEVGPSELGSCSRQMYYKLDGQTITNFNLLKLSSVMGTAIHTYLEQEVKKVKPSILTEIEVGYEGMKGHIDMYDPEGKEVLDWKTTSKKNQAYFPTKSQRWQVQVYGYLLTKNGKEVKKVSLISLARDGTENDILFHTEDYNEEMALEALAWLTRIEQMEEPPPPEKDGVFCKGYCPFYDESGLVGCKGRIPNPKDLPLVEDEMFTSAAKDYLELSSQIKELEKKQDLAKAVLEGTSGQTPDGIKVVWSEVAGRSSVDEAEVLKLLGSVPKKTGNGYMKLSVKP